MKLNIFDLKDSAILYLYAERANIQINPDYQRMGEVWNDDNKQLLIDSIINRFDVPKIYFHHLSDFDKKSKFEFAIIDGRQRLEAIWGFIDGKFPLADDFTYLPMQRYKRKISPTPNWPPNTRSSSNCLMQLALRWS